MAKKIDITYGDVTGFPVGTVLSKITVSVTDPSGAVTPQDVAPGTAEVIVTATTVGDYGFTIQAHAADGSTLGTAVTGTFSVAAPTTVSLPLPVSATVSDA